MRKTYMTTKENEEQKQKIRYSSQDCRLIKEVYPSIQQIVIDYTATHTSAFGSIGNSNKIIYEPNHTNTFEIDCLNNECTKGYFDLSSEIYRMFKSKLTEHSGIIYCEGSEAPDHIYQHCGTTLHYKINISYS